MRLLLAAESAKFAKIKFYAKALKSDQMKMRRKREKKGVQLRGYARGLTQVVEAVAGAVERTRVELEPYDCEDDDGEKQQQGDVDQGPDGLANGAHHHLQT
jgi:hypothetical protein